MQLLSYAELEQIALGHRHCQHGFIAHLVDAKCCKRDVQFLVVDAVGFVDLWLNWRDLDDLCDGHGVGGDGRAANAVCKHRLGHLCAFWSVQAVTDGSD